MNRAVVAWVVLLGLFAVPRLVATADVTPPSPFHSADGLSVVSATPDGARTWHLVVSTPALGEPVRVNVLMPEGYAASAARYPVLYLFHGTSGGADDWLTSGNAAAAMTGTR
jgi:hypothetical protein